MLDSIDMYNTKMLPNARDKENWENYFAFISFFTSNFLQTLNIP